MGKKNNRTKIECNSICTEYIKGMKSDEICKAHHCSTNTLTKILQEQGIKRRQISLIDKDLSKFYDLSLPETQYWIGYICADGNIEFDTKRGEYKVSIFSMDYEIVNEYKRYFINSGVRLYKRPSKLYECSISSKELCLYMINTLNITPNKSISLNPNIKYTKNFILGYFDGDGCIRNSINSTRYECNITCGSLKFLVNIKQILDNNNIYSILYKHPDCNAYKIRIDRKKDSEKFYRFLYTGKVFCLSRKLNNFVHLFGNIEN